MPLVRPAAAAALLAAATALAADPKEELKLLAGSKPRMRTPAGVLLLK